MVLLVITLALYLAATKMIGLKDSIMLLKGISRRWILAALLFEFGSYLGGSLMLKFVLNRLYYKIRFRDLFRIATIGNFAIHFFPIAGAGEMALLLYLFKEKGLTAGDTLFMFMIRSIFMYTALIILFVISLFFIQSLPHISPIIRILLIVVILLILYVVYFAINRIRHKKRFYKSGRNFFRFINFFGRLFTKKSFVKHLAVESLVTEIYLGFQMFRKDPKSAWKVIGGGLIYWIGDMLCLFFILKGFGYQIHIAPLVFTYTATTFASIISFIPGGLGVNESVSSLLLISFGAPASVAVFSVLVYRLISFWLIMPIGFLSFIGLRSARQHIKKSKNTEERNRLLDK